MALVLHRLQSHTQTPLQRALSALTALQTLSLSLIRKQVICLQLRAPEEPVYYDSSAAAIAVCGLIEIAKSVAVFYQSLSLCR